MDPRRPDGAQIQEAAALLKLGRVVIFPTETVYGIGACLSQKDAVRRIYELKERPLDKPLTWHLVDHAPLASFGVSLSPLVQEIVWRFLPGPYTLIVPGREGNTLGIRFPDHPVARRLIAAVGEPILATSVNKSGEEPAVSGKKAARVFDGQVDLVLDGAVTRFGTDSTIMDMTGPAPRTIRKGPLADELERFIAMNAGNEHPKTEHILFVCTGNTCRSAMAAGWLGAEIKKRKLEGRYSVLSSGTSAAEGAPAALEAVQVLRQLGADISGHQARSLSKKMLQEADRIFVMTASHVDAILTLDRDAAKKVTVLGVSDPLGMDLGVYRNTLNEIEEKLKSYLPWLA